MKELFADALLMDEEQFRQLVKKINRDISKSNRTAKNGEKQKLLDEKYLMQRFRRIKAFQDRKRFNELHECKYCFYFQKPRRCFATEQCPLEIKGAARSEKKNKKNCPKDPTGDCPYGDKASNCIGICWREILQEQQERKKKNEQEDYTDG